MNILYKAAGFMSLGLGILGIFLPLMPTTVFVLMAAWCFAKSSPRLHTWLADSKVFGVIITQWESRRCIPQKARYLATGSMLVAGGFAFLAMDGVILKCVVVLTIGLSIFTVMSVKVCPVLPRGIRAGYQSNVRAGR